MKTIRNINPTLGMDVTFTAKTEPEAVAQMLEAVHGCGPEFASITELVECRDYEVLVPRSSAAAALGSAKSEAKTAAARENAKKPRPNAQGQKRPRKPKTE